MPLLCTGERTMSRDVPVIAYEFAEKHRPQWEKFWKEMKGDIDKLFEFAKKAGVDRPQDWVNALSWFLFSTFTGSPKLLVASAKKFDTFLAKIAEEHVKNPKDKWFYLNLGTDAKHFIRALEHAAACPSQKDAIAYVNARIGRGFGNLLYSEFLLARVPHVENLKSIASDMNKRAYDIEVKETGKKMSSMLKEGDIIRHCKFGEEEFEVVDVMDEDDIIVVKDKDGKELYIFDPWNVQ